MPDRCLHSSRGRRCRLLLLQLLPLLLPLALWTAASAEDVDPAAFCGGLTLDAYGVGSQASLIQDQTDAFDLLALIKSFRGAQGEGAMIRLIQSHQWSSKGPQYAQSLIVFAAPGIAFCIAFLIWWLCMSGCRLCGRCCRPQKALEDYSKCEKCCPVITYIVFGLLAGAFSIVGLLYLLSAANAITGVLCDVEALRADTGTFLTNITDPLDDIAAATGVATARVSGRVGHAASVQANFSQALASLGNFSDSLAALPLKPRFGSAPHPCDCSFCAPTATQTASVTQDLNASASGAIADLSSIEVDVTAQVVNVGDQIVKAAVDAKNNTKFMVTYVFEHGDGRASLVVVVDFGREVFAVFCFAFFVLLF
jgi:hypothetical protein